MPEVLYEDQAKIHERLAAKPVQAKIIDAAKLRANATFLKTASAKAKARRLQKVSEARRYSR